MSEFKYTVNPDGTITRGQWELVPQGPVRTETVTTRRIVPGVYGRLYVSRNRDPGKVRVGLTETDNRAPLVFALNADELDSLAMVASQLAEALRDDLD